MDTPNLIYEYYPEFIYDRLEARVAAEKKHLPSYVEGYASGLIMEELKLWRVGTLKVSFKGGDRDLHAKIAKSAMEWTRHGNVHFDFGFNSQTKMFRTWHQRDDSHIRIGFDYQGYWSLVGTDSKDERIVKRGETTMNFANFDQQLPPDWQATVLHEFGHALGFHHSHQSPDVECKFNWPYLYAELSKPPNNWSKAQVDRNLRQLRKHGLRYSAHDPLSIMHYSFAASMFVDGTQSPCCTGPNQNLSEVDKEMMSVAYPYQQKAIESKDHDRMTQLETLVSLPGLPSVAVRNHQDHLRYYQNVHKTFPDTRGLDVLS